MIPANGAMSASNHHFELRTAAAPARAAATNMEIGPKAILKYRLSGSHLELS
jgi:hypothetical protein